MEDFFKLLMLGGLVGGGYMVLKSQEQKGQGGNAPAKQPRPQPAGGGNAGLAAILGIFGKLIGNTGAGSAAPATMPDLSGLFGAPGAAASSSKVTGGKKQLLDLISIPESGGDYNRIWAGISRADYPKKPLTKMTVGEVLDWQNSIDPKYNSEAAGRYQIMEDTLRSMGLPRSMLFDAAGQDRAGLILLERRGLNDFMSGRISATQFAINLAKEWAGLPVPIKMTGAKKTVNPGESYYSAFNGNRAGISVDAVMSAIANI